MSGFIPTLRTGRAHPHPEPISGALYSAVELMPGDRSVVILDQRKLPTIEKYEMLNRPEQVAEAISDMLVRGAPAIGIAAAYGLVLAAAVTSKESGREFLEAMQRAADTLRATRPTAVNLAWALDRMMRIAGEITAFAGPERLARLADEARNIHREDVAACKKIGELGAQKIKDGATILTHCNAGALATGGFGTALGVIRAARAAGKKVHVLADETRPLLQGARLTAWELEHDGISVEVITDSMAASFFAARAIDLVVVGADRIAKNGDVANKIGTYGVACLARLHEVPFFVAAPWSTVDLTTPNGGAIPIEQRSEQEVSHIGEVRLMPDGVRARNPAFDVTPAILISAIFTERGAAEPPSESAIDMLRSINT
jgi:methylthioribose-1-phosphate isomerase